MSTLGSQYLALFLSPGTFRDQFSLNSSSQSVRLPLCEGLWISPSRASGRLCAALYQSFRWIGPFPGARRLFVLMLAWWRILLRWALAFLLYIWSPTPSIFYPSFLPSSIPQRAALAATRTSLFPFIPLWEGIQWRWNDIPLVLKLSRCSIIVRIICGMGHLFGSSRARISAIWIWFDVVLRESWIPCRSPMYTVLVVFFLKTLVIGLGFPQIRMGSLTFILFLWLFFSAK